MMKKAALFVVVLFAQVSFAAGPADYQSQRRGDRLRADSPGAIEKFANQLGDLCSKDAQACEARLNQLGSYLSRRAAQSPEFSAHVDKVIDEIEVIDGALAEQIRSKIQAGEVRANNAEALALVNPSSNKRYESSQKPALVAPTIWGALACTLTVSGGGGSACGSVDTDSCWESADCSYSTNMSDWKMNTRAGVDMGCMDYWWNVLYYPDPDYFYSQYVGYYDYYDSYYYNYTWVDYWDCFDTGYYEAWDYDYMCYELGY